VTRQRMRAWFTRVPGRWFQAEERHQLSKVLPTLFGYHLVQIGDMYCKGCLNSTRIQHCMVVDVELQENPPATERPRSGIRGAAEGLPIATDYIDVVVMPHVLEFSEAPHQVLREVDRILIPEGHVVILGFNPWGPWMLWRLILSWRGKPPWCGRFVSQARARDWLQLLGFDIVSSQYYFYRPPLRQKSIMKRLRFIDILGRRWWPILSGGYLILAKKRVSTLTPIRPRWRPRRSRLLSPEVLGNRGINRTKSE
jgi:SAM-dependent methyltransferase